MKNTPESFDHLIKSKLEEVKVDPSLADAYWQQMQLPITKQKGPNKFRRYYWWGASVILTLLVIITVTKSGKNLTTNSGTNTIQRTKKATPVNTYDTLTMMNEKQITVSRTKAQSHIMNEDDSDKSGPGQLVIPSNQPRGKLTDDSIFHHQATVTLNSLNRLKEDDTATLTKKSLLQTGIQQTDSNLKKIDSLNKKPEAKKAAPYIIW